MALLSTHSSRLLGGGVLRLLARFIKMESGQRDFFPERNWCRVNKTRTRGRNIGPVGINRSD